MQTQQHLTQIVKPHNGKLNIEIPVADADADDAEATYHVTIDVVPQPPSLTAKDQAVLVDRLFGSIPELEELSAGVSYNETVQ